MGWLKARAANQPSRADALGDPHGWSGPSNLVGWCQVTAWADLWTVDHARLYWACKVVLGLLEQS